MIWEETSVYFDTHCHLCLFHDIEGVIRRCRANSVKYVLSVAMYYQDNERLLQLATEYPEVIPALGIHPIEAANLSDVDEKLDSVKNLILKHKVRIVGEIGLDRYFVKGEANWKQEERIFRNFLDFASVNNLAVNLHGKYAEGELIETLKEYDLKKVIIHWFAGTSDLIKEGIRRGYYFSVTPEVFYGKRMKTLVELVPIDQLLSESDGPVKYKEPHRFTGEPALMKDVVREIALIKKRPIEEVQHILYENATGLFLP